MPKLQKANKLLSAENKSSEFDDPTQVKECKKLRKLKILSATRPQNVFIIIFFFFLIIS